MVHDLGDLPSRERHRAFPLRPREASAGPALVQTIAARGMKIRLEGSVRPRAYGRVTRDGGFLGERSWAGRFGRCAASAGFSLGRPCDLPGSRDQRGSRAADRAQGDRLHERQPHRPRPRRRGVRARTRPPRWPLVSSRAVPVRRVDAGRQTSSNGVMSVRSSASRNVSTETSWSTSVSDRNTLTRRPVACSTMLDEALGHLLLKPAADVLDRLALAAFDERLLGARERLLQHDNDEVVDDVGLGPVGPCRSTWTAGARTLSRSSPASLPAPSARPPSLRSTSAPQRLDCTAPKRRRWPSERLRRRPPSPQAAAVNGKVTRPQLTRALNQGARRAAPHRHLILRAPRSHPARAIACDRTPTRSATRFRTPKRGSGPRVPGPPRRRIRPVSVRRRAGSRG